MYKWACKKVSFNHLSGRNEQNYRSSPVLTYSKRALFVRHAITCHTPWKTRKWNFDGCYILTCAIPMQSSTNWAINSSKSWSFCEFVIFFFSPLRDSALPLNSVDSKEKKPLAPRVVDDDQYKWIYERTHNLGSNPRFRPEFFQALISQLLVVCLTTMVNQIFIFIPSCLFLFLYFFLPLYLSNYFSFFPSFLTPLIYISVVA